jgi:hypothetical protein
MPDGVGARVALSVDGAAGEAACQHTGNGGSEEEGAGALACETAHLLDEVARLAGANPVGDAVQPVRGLDGELGGGAVVVATIGHLVQLTREVANALLGLLLAVLGLLLGLPAGLAEQVAGLAPDLVRDLACLIARGCRDIAAGIGGGAPDVGGLLLSYLGGRWGPVLPRLLRHARRLPTKW